MSILDDLRAAIARVEQAKPELHYAVTDQVSAGKLIRITGFDIYPEVWLIHPDDWPAARDELAPHCRLVNFREWQPNQADIAKTIPQTIEYPHESELLKTRYRVRDPW